MPADINTLQLMHNLKQLLSVGLYPGSHCQYVAAAIEFVEGMIRQNTPVVPPTTTAPEPTAADFDAAGTTLGPKGPTKVSHLKKRR
jgi:hypothetical protein